MITSRRGFKALIIGGVALVLLTGLIGWMHTKSARPILAALGVHCPVDDVSTAQVDALRTRGLAGMRGSAAAPVRPAATGLALDQTTEADVQAWAKTSGGTCETVVHGYRFLRCRGVDAKALGVAGPAVSELWLSFGTSGKLIGVDIYRRGLDAAGEVAAWSGATGKLQSQLGKPPVAFGDPSPSALMASTYLTARVQYKYTDYIATVTAANLPDVGLSVREQYLSAKM